MAASPAEVRHAAVLLASKKHSADASQKGQECVCAVVSCVHSRRARRCASFRWSVHPAAACRQRAGTWLRGCAIEFIVPAGVDYF